MTPAARAAFEAVRAGKALPRAGPESTVGAAARDAAGGTAAATSTGGMIDKRAGRVGDSPLVGAGTYADDLAGAVSTTGNGEGMIRLGAARLAAFAMGRGAPSEEALRATIEALRGARRGVGRRRRRRSGGALGLVPLDGDDVLGDGRRGRRRLRSLILLTRAGHLGSGEERADL